jgi:hypothetical protein
MRINERELRTSEQIFLEAENRMTIAQETRNRQAAWDARAPLDKARSDLKKVKQAGARLELARKRAEASFAAARSFLVSGEGGQSRSQAWGLASLRDGKAEILRQGGEKIALEGSRPRLLEPGDELMTMGAGGAEVLVLNGRCVVALGERSRLKLEEDGKQGQILRLLQGKLYAAVDTADDFADLLQGGGGQVEADPKLEEAVSRTRERARELADKKFLARGPSACFAARGGKFTVELTQSGGTEISVFEAAVEAGDAECAQQVTVEEGFKVIVTKDGISEPEKAPDLDRWWEK